MDEVSAATARAYDRLRARYPAEFLELVASEYGSSVTNPPRATRLGFSAPMGVPPTGERFCTCCQTSEREVEIDRDSGLCLFCQPCPRCGRMGTGCEDDPPICDRCPEDSCVPDEATGRCTVCNRTIDLLVPNITLPKPHFDELLQRIESDQPAPKTLREVLAEAPNQDAIVVADDIVMAPTSLDQQFAQLLEPAADSQAVEPTPVEPAHVDEPAQEEVVRVDRIFRIGLDHEGKHHAGRGAPGTAGYALCGALLTFQEPLATKARVTCYKCRGKL